MPVVVLPKVNGMNINGLKTYESIFCSPLIVCELMGRVRNVVLIECTSGLGKPKRGRDFGWEGTLAG